MRGSCAASTSSGRDAARVVARFGRGRRVGDARGRRARDAGASGGRAAARRLATRESGGGGDEEANEGRKSSSNDEDASTGERRGRGASTGRKSARRAFRRFVAAPRAEESGREKSRTYERTMAYARRLATERDMEVRDVVWAPALWAAVANEWTPEQAAEALARLEGRGAELLMRRYAEKRRVRACEIIYKECLKRGYDDGAGEVAVEMAKVLEWAPGRAADAEVAWARILTARAGNVKARAEAYCAMLEGLCLQPTRVKAFARAYGEFREEFCDAATGVWKPKVSAVLVQRAYTAACRLVNNAHNHKFARRVTYDLLNDHMTMSRELDFTLATDYCVCALLGAATANTAHVAAELFETALETNVQLGAKTWSYAVTMYASLDMVDEAMKMLDRLETLSFMQSGTLGAVAFAAAFSSDKGGSADSEKVQRRANELKALEAHNAKERARVERAYAKVMQTLNKQGKFKLALRVFTRMQSSGVSPISSATYINLYEALIESPADGATTTIQRRNNLNRVVQTLRTHVGGLDALMVALEVASHAGVADVCENIHDRLQWHGHMNSASIRSRVWQCMMIVAYKTQDRQGAMRLYEEWLNAGERKTAVGDDFWFYLIRSYCDPPAANVDVAVMLLEDAVRESATVLRKAVPARTFNIVIQACARARRPTLAVETLERMRDAGVSPTHVTYLGALRACASTIDLGHSSGKEDTERSVVDATRDLLAAARADGVRPTSKMWYTAIRACGRAGDVDAARDVFEDMRASGCEPNVYSCTALIGAYGAARDVRAAMDFYWIARRDFKVLPDSNTLHTMLEAVQSAIGDRAFDELTADASEVYADMRALGVRPNDAVLEILKETAVEDILLGHPSTRANRLTVGVVKEWDDIAALDLREHTAAEARVAVLQLLQTLRDRRAAGLAPPGDVRVFTGRGKIRNQIQKLARDVSLILSIAEDDESAVVITPTAIDHWLAKP